MENETNTYMNWGKWIVLVFILFAVFIGTLVTVCMRQDISLVSKDYYRDELAFQDQIVRINNANQLQEKPTIRKKGEFIEVGFSMFGKMEKGVLKLFRPSDAHMDKIFTLHATAESTQLFPIGGIGKGMYRARMQWIMNGKEYFIESIVNI